MHSRPSHLQLMGLLLLPFLLRQFRNKIHAAHDVDALNIDDGIDVEHRRRRKTPTLTSRHSMANVSGYDTFSTSSIYCRRSLEHWQNSKIAEWMWSRWPLLEYAWELRQPETNTRYFSILFQINVWRHSFPFLKEKLIVETQWHWQDQFGNNHTTKEEAAKQKRGMSGRRLYLDIFPPKHKNGDDVLFPKLIWPVILNSTTQVESIIYDVEPFLKCSEIERDNPPPRKIKIGACISRFWGQHDLVPEWIAYHRLLGVQHFWFFVAEPFENIANTMPRFEPDITYVPYNYVWRAHYKNAPADFRINYGGEALFQGAANNHCLYFAKQYGLDFIFTPDLDEYVNILDPNITHSSTKPPLQQYLEKKKSTKLDQVCLFGAGYGRNPLEEGLDKKFELSIDFTYRKDRRKSQTKDLVYHDGKGAGGRKKCFYNPLRVWDVFVHSLQGSKGGGYSIMEQISTVELCHFRSPLNGPQETMPEDLVSYPKMRDLYRDKVIAIIHKKNWTLPKLQHRTNLVGYSNPRSRN